MRYAFDLSNYDEVKTHAPAIYDRLMDGSWLAAGWTKQPEFAPTRHILQHGLTRHPGVRTALSIVRVSQGVILLLLEPAVQHLSTATKGDGDGRPADQHRRSGLGHGAKAARRT